MIWPLCRTSCAPCFIIIIKFIFYWRIIGLKHCVGFCYTITWISHSYTNVLSLLNLPLTFIPSPTLHCHRRPDLNFLHHTSNSNWLHVLHMVIVMFQCYSPNFSHPLLPPLWVPYFKWWFGDPASSFLLAPLSPWVLGVLNGLSAFRQQWERESIKYLRDVLRCLLIKEVSINHFCPPFSDESPVIRTLVTSRKARNRSSSIFSVKYLVSLSVSQLWVLNF